MGINPSMITLLSVVLFSVLTGHTASDLGIDRIISMLSPVRIDYLVW